MYGSPPSPPTEPSPVFTLAVPMKPSPCPSSCSTVVTKSTVPDTGTPSVAKYQFAVLLKDAAISDDDTHPGSGVRSLPLNRSASAATNQVDGRNAPGKSWKTHVAPASPSSS